jgi:hypothetical protein
MHAKMLTHHDISGPDSGIGVANGVGETYRNVVIPVRKEARCLRGRGGFGIDDSWQGSYSTSTSSAASSASARLRATTMATGSPM